MLGEMKFDKGFPAELVPLRLTVGKEQVDAFAEISGDFNPIHIDDEAARQVGMKGAVAHGSLSLNMIWESIESSFACVGDPRLQLDVRFKAPVYVSDTVEAGGKKRSDREYEVWVYNQDGTRVIEGVLIVCD